TEHGYVTLDFDATLLDAHSDKEQAAPTYKKGFGFFPLGAWLDNTAEALAAILRPGNAGANTASDHVGVLEEALAQLPVRPRGLDPLNGGAHARPRRLGGGYSRLPQRPPGQGHRVLGRGRH